MSFLHGASHVAIFGGTQVAIAAGSSVTISHSSNALKDLSAAAAHTAMHNSVARSNAPRCHRNTRTKYLNKFELWMLGQGDEFEGKRLIWLHGGAGAGKSAIMQSTVDRCAQHGVILGTFFFSRTDSSRNYAEILVPTLAYQVASSFPEAMAVLERIINRNPLIFKTSLHTQAYELLVRPLRYLFENGVLDNASPVRRVFIIDGLDECSEPEEQVLVIQAVTSILCDHHLPVHFVIASRPELTITSAFQREKQLGPILTTISLEEDDAESDIRQFIGDSFLNILDSHPWRMHIRMPWPSPDSIDLLVEKSSGHFIYAATAMKFIASSDEHPPRALEVVEGIEASRTGSPFTELDALYTYILSSARYSKRVLDILRLRYLSHFPSTVASVCYLHDVSEEDVLLFLSDVQSLVSLVPDGHASLYITPKHASLYDFFHTESRSKGIYISRAAYHAYLLPQFFHLVDAGPRPHTLGSYIEDNLRGLFLGLRDGLVHSKNTKLLQSLVSQHVPNDIWKFCVRSLQLAQSLQDDGTIKIRLRSTRYLCIYTRAIHDATALHDDTLYFKQFQMYIELLLDDISDIMDRKPQYCIIPALMFSSRPSGLVLADNLLEFWHRQFHIHGSYRTHFIHLFSYISNHKIDPRVFEAIKRLPQSQHSWSAELAFAMKLVLQQLVHLSWLGPSKILHARASPHRQWLRQHKGLKHISLGSPKLSSRISRRLVTVKADAYSEIDQLQSSTTLPFLLSCWRWFKPHGHNDLQHLIWKQRYRLLILLKAVILYLQKSDCTSEVVRLARRMLPMAAQWHPKAMKRARAEMDAYVQRWDESPDGLLERAQLLSVNDMD